jgi:putative MATE family efflux protein
MLQQKVPTALGTEKVSKLLMQYAIPSIIAMTASSLYNMVDSIFIGQGVGAMAISGIAITFPLMNITAAFGSLVGVGAATLTSVKLGQKDYDTARRILGNVFVLNILLGALLTLVALPLLTPILYFFGASDNTLPYARDYMQIILIGNIITHLYFGLNALLRSSGHPEKAMYATIATVLVNTILDPIFIFGLDMGIRGAAIATVIAQTLSLMWQIKLFSNKNELLHFQPGIFKLKKRIVMDSLAIGLSPFLMNLASCVVVILINNALVTHGGDYAIGAYGLVNRLVFVAIMVVMGFNQGMQPIAGYNFGAHHYDRVLQVTRLTMLWATGVTTVATLLCMTIPELLVRIFTTDEELIRISVKAMRIILLVFPVVGFQMVTGNFFQSIGMASKAIFLSLTRQLIFLLPCILILPHYFGEDGVWYSMPISDAVATIVAGVMLWHQFQLFKKQVKTA